MSSCPRSSVSARRGGGRLGRAALAFAAAVIAAACLASCGGGHPSAQGTTTTNAPQGTTTTTAPPITTATVTINGTAVPVPHESGTTPITPLQTSGEQVVLTAHGFLPRTLYAALHTDVTYTNLTDKTVSISFFHTGDNPVSVPPGGSFMYLPHELQYAYTSSTGFEGYVVVGAFTP